MIWVAGLEIVDVRGERLRAEFFDVGAVIFFLRKVIWTVPGFTVAGYRQRLRELYKQIQHDGMFIAHSSRTLIEARKTPRLTASACRQSSRWRIPLRDARTATTFRAPPRAEVSAVSGDLEEWSLTNTVEPKVKRAESSYPHPFQFALRRCRVRLCGHRYRRCPTDLSCRLLSPQ